MSATDRTESRPDKGLRSATGRGRDEWYARLDAWGATDREYREIADWLTGTHELSTWWAQKLIVEYEQDRGVREPGVRRDGTFEVGASRTVGVPVGRLFEAFENPSVRRRWLTGARLRESQPRRSVRFDWNDGGSRVNVSFTAKGRSKSQVLVQHDHLRDAKVAEKTKAYWRERLTALKNLLED